MSLISTLATAAPSGAHPRLWLDSATKQGLSAQVGVANSPVERGHARCSAARDNPSDYDDGGWQGFEFVTTLSGCLVSYAASGNADDLKTALQYFNVLLDDYQKAGDGAGGDNVVSHDSGYAMRTFAPYSAIAYDWLHDAPGMTETLRAHARARFDAWIKYYSASGYLRDVAGANYQAGYAFASTLIAIAEGGEAGSVGDAHWALVKDTIWGKDLAPAFAADGVLAGGDWPEGWQYGPLSVLEYALAARAMQDNGAPVAGAGAWADSLVLRFAHDLTPVTKQVYAAGDSDNEAPNRAPDNGPLLAVIAGPASDQAKAWARRLNDDLGLKNENPLFDGLAAARAGESSALPSDLPTNHLASGTGNWYMRGSFDDSTVWGVFQCSRRLVGDHQHNNAGNWVLTRGADDLVVDPTPYGSVSTLSSNAPAIDSSSMPEGYSPSQGYWGQTTRLAWARQSGSGVAAARCDYADQFARDGVPSDVAHASRDYVLIPDGDSGEVVLIDRAVTADSGHALHLRVRTPATLALSSNRATGTLGSSSLAVERVYSSSGTPSVRTMPQGTECASSDHRCDFSRLPAGSEYRLDVAGPSALAMHVVAARGQAAGTHTSLAGTGYRGVVIPRTGTPVAVITSDATDGAAKSSLAYAAPAGALHVVVDAPVDAGGKSDVSATLDGSNCRVTVTPHADSSGGYVGAPLIVRLSSSCAVSDDGSQATSPPSDPGTGGTGGTTSSTGGTGGTTSSTGGTGGTTSSTGGTGGTTSSTGGTGGTTSSTGGTTSSTGGTGGTSSSTGGTTSSTGGSAGAQGGTASGSGGTSSTAGAAGRRQRPRWWPRRSASAAVGEGALSTQSLPPNASAEGDFSEGDFPSSSGAGCSVSSTSKDAAGGALGAALMSALLVLWQRRRGQLALQARACRATTPRVRTVRSRR